MIECAACEKVCEGKEWQPGQCVVACGIFCCSRECGIKWADENCVNGAPVEECYATGDQWEVGFRTIHTVSGKTDAGPLSNIVSFCRSPENMTEPKFVSYVEVKP